MSDHDIQATRARQIGGVLEFYHEDFTTYLATAISFAEKLPIEIDNQIRDAFTHLSRAQKATSIADIVSESSKARSHIERANRDCLKTSIIFARIELESIRANVHFRHGIPAPTLEAGYQQLKKMRKEAYVAETRGDTTQVEKLEEILRLTMDTIDSMKDAYGEEVVKRGGIINFVKRHSKIFMYVLLTLVGTTLGLAIRPYIGQIIDFLKSFF